MGAFGKDTPRLMWLCIVATFLLLIIDHNVDQVSAESKIDSDLVFENLEQTDLTNHENHHRIARDSSLGEEISLESSPPAEEHWLSNTVNRIKRSINNFLSTKSKNSHVRRKRKFGRVPRQNQQQEAEYDDGDEEDEQYNNVGETFDFFKPDNRSVENGRNETRFGADDDDEDNILDHSGEHGSGDEPTIPIVPPVHPVYYRISFTVNEPFVSEYADRNSFQHKDFSAELIKEIDRLYENIPGTQSATVIRIERREADSFTSKVTIDLGSNGFNDDNKIKDVLYQHIATTHRLGKYAAKPDDFQFRTFEAPPLVVCNPNEIPCRNGECVPSEARCNRIFECSDRSDEDGCDIYPEFTTKEPTDGLVEPDGSSGDGEDVVSPTPVSPNLNVPQTHCRADDVVRCEDGSRSICADQICDGIYDCANGGDEENCPFDCAEGELSCDLTRCIPLSKRCDGVPDCSDRTDEIDCAVCSESEIKCDNKCFPSNRRCDGTSDCSDGSDESNCPTPESQCRPGLFSCGDGLCLLPQQRCDGRPDCRNGIDETNCTVAHQCRDDQFTCQDGTCIPESSKCDSKYDCGDLSDERNCPCKSTDFRCGNGICIPSHLRCNGIHNCQDRTDEMDCPSSPRPGGCEIGEIGCNPQNLCTPDEFRCSDGSCVTLAKRCDGKSDCPHSEDEESCASCAANQYKCTNGDCIDETKKCDRKYDCPDGSDEHGCDECNEDQVQCEEGGCVIGKRCDGLFDCSDGSDERGCQFCAPDQFRCAEGGCIEEHLRCDGTFHCSDGSDEQNCVTTCPDDQFRCSDGLCLDNRRRCDRYPDCSDSSDEQGCPGSEGPVHNCSSEQFNCGNTCIELRFRCDGFADCTNEADEQGCSRCDIDEFTCKSGRCIPNDFVCDGRRDCDDGSDEFDCQPSRQCTVSEFRCDSGDCIPNYLVCSGVAECTDGSDERECQCRTDQFRCSNGNCVDGNLRCNRRNDCSDGSDEFDCPTERPPPPTELPPTSRPSPQPVTCPPGYQPCNSGDRCILRSQLCDGRVDCNDMSDEFNCPGPSDGLNLRTYPNAQEIKENREVVFQCRDEGPLRARVRWSRPNGEPLPPGARDLNGRLEMPNIKVEHGGTYICEAVGYPPSTPGAQVSVHLQVDRWIPPPTRPPTACALHQATCSNGDCIDKQRVCDGRYDCTDGSDENRCNPNGCEPNEFRCANKKCILKTWRCDSDDDCGDRSDEESCATNPPGSLCAYHQFACHSNNQCIPRSYHCDLERDCIDGSDEIGCSLPVVSKPPPPMVTLTSGSILEITCTAVGVPTPEIVWRLNWGHIPPKCRTTSVNGVGTLICPDIQVEDQGAYSCEVINIKGTIFAVPDTILVVDHPGVCAAGYFNEEARTQAECIKCFCFGQSTKCSSADLFIYQFQPPFDTLRILGVRIDSGSGAVEIRDEPIYRNAQPTLTPVGRNGVHSQLPPYGEITSTSLVPYFAMPENYYGNQLKSYGGYLRFNVRHYNRGYPITGPTVILTGNGYTLLSQQPHAPQPNRDDRVEVRFFAGDWVKRTEGYPETLATREEIMMALADVSNILIKLQYNDGPLNTTISNIEMDSAAAPNSGLGPASYVEQCECPVGYTGTSCERCADGYERRKTGPWLGQCYKQIERCPDGTYGDPSQGRPCEVCPCPLTSPSNQFARTCKLDYDGDVTCDCPPGYVGRRCEQCAPGYSGNPLIPGDSCRPVAPSTCNANGTITEDQRGCRCKDYVDGPSCSSCKPNTFYLSSVNQFGCIACFCMGITRQCTSSNWYRDQIGTAFSTSNSGFTLIDTENRESPISTNLDQGRHEISYSSFGSPNVHYWSLPPLYLGNKISSYGGYLRYTLRYVPLPGGQSSRNSAADVELVSANQISLLYYSREQVQPTGSAQTFVVPLLEQYWQRSDGQRADREHMLMALADLEAIYIKATYNTNTRESALISVSLDTANEYNTGSSERALAVEQCHCPPGYRGLSCEDCDVGFTRADEGIYLGLCEPCNCNGNSNECDPETGVCSNCLNFTTGESCEICLPGYQGDPGNGIPCRYNNGPPIPCQCNTYGSISNECFNGMCRCKANVEGSNCDRCRPGTFGLEAANTDGCQVCFCSGVTTECTQGNYYYEQIPTDIVNSNHGFTLTDQSRSQSRDSDFQINPITNEIGYTFRPSDATTWYWSLPRKYTGNQIKSYGGRLEFTQRYTQRPQAGYLRDKDIIIVGNGVTIYWSNPEVLTPGVANKISVVLHPSANWQRLDTYQGPRPASREDIITALAYINGVLVRARLSSDTESSFISDITLDTAIEQPTRGRAIEVENCRCPQGYRGSSCESCAPGYYRDRNDYRTGPLGSCSRCQCSGHEESCDLGRDNRVVCNCLPGFSGLQCEFSEPPGPWINTTVSPPTTTPTPTLTMEITIYPPQRIEIIEAGRTLNLTCTARSLVGRGPIRIHWAKDGGDLPPNSLDDGYGTLLIRSIRVSDSGRYICEAFDGFTIESGDISVTVGPSIPSHPRAVISPSFVDVQVGQPIEIHCAATGNPQPNLRFIRRDGQQLNPEHYFQNGDFRIAYALKSDEGQYQCIASNTEGSDTVSVDIYVRDSSPAPGTVAVQISPQTHTGIIGETFSLRCQANVEGTVRWSKQNDLLPYNSREDRGVLTVNSATPEDSGIYMCTVTISSGYSGSATAEVRIEDRNTTIYPSAKVTPERITISQGSSAELHCEAGGYPIPTIKWTKLGSEIPSHIEQIGSTLYIRNVQFVDRGVYVCVVSNSHGLAQASTIVEVNRVEVPIVSIYPQGTLTLIKGNSAMLQCRIEAGIPRPTLSWIRTNGAQLSRNIEQMSDGTLRITGVTEEERGEYVCSAENEAGRAQATANIVVQVPPEVWTIPNENHILIQSNQYIRLECHASGYPSPTVQWHKHGEPSIFGRLAPSSDVDRSGYSQEDTAILEIARFSANDQGLYICEARNDVGTVEKRIELALDSSPSRGDIVGGNRSRGGDDPTETDDNEVNPDGGYKHNEVPPSYPTPSYPPVHSYDERFTAPVGTRAELRCQVNTNNDRDAVFVTWTRTNNVSLPNDAFIRGGTLYIDNVQPSAGGEYRCVGTHRRTGRVVFSVTAHLDVISPPRITLVPPRQIVHPGDNAYIQCSASGQQPITIRWLPVGRTMPVSVNTRDGLIQFNNIQLSDAGRYRCTAVNTAGEADAVADVVVEENIRRPTVTAENRQQQAPIGSSIALRCRTQNSSIVNNIRWFRERLPLPENSRINGETLHIFNLQLRDGGRYYCEISNEGGASSDYIDLQVINERWYCKPDEWHCMNNNRCIPWSLHCNGYNDCGDNSDEENCNPRIRRGPTSVTVPPVTPLYITPPETDHRIGENIEINCHANEPGVITSWSKLYGRLAANVQHSGGTLRILSLRPENAGIYRCEATGYQGLYQKDYHLNIIDQRDIQEDAPLVVKRAPQGSTVVLECKTDLEQPVTYFWTKQGSELSDRVSDVYKRSIQLNEISSSDAGIYICTQSRGPRKIETPTVLVVTGIVPHFAQAPSSYIELNTLPDSYLQFSFEISFKPQNSDGLILYNGNKGNDRKQDFISLSLANGVPEFRYMLGHSVTTVRGNRSLAQNEWHTIKVIRYKKKVTMYVDGAGPFVETAEGKYISLDLVEPLYLGGVPDFNRISPEANVVTGFVGCISRFKVGHTHLDITREARNKIGITTCETCSENRCENQGVCQEALSPEGYSCICPARYSGSTCSKLKGEACSPYACGTGRCVDNENGFDCLCPMGRAGRRCEREITVNEPAFSSNGYIAYPTPKIQRNFKVSLKLKPNDVRDGILLYCGETDEGHGDFVSLAVKNRRVEFTYNVGGRSNVIQSRKEVQAGEWNVVTASRGFSEGRLIVNGEMTSGSTPRNHKVLNLLTPLFVGGYDKQNVKINDKVGVHNGFNGCISEVSVSGLDLDVVTSADDSANVGECSAVNDADNDVNGDIQYGHEDIPSPPPIPYDRSKTGCSGNPCRNGASCYPLSPIDYKCSCLQGYSGRNCEISANFCDQYLPCQHEGSCTGNSTSYECSCLLGYTGRNCEQRVQLRNDAHFNGKSYLEFEGSLLDHTKENEEEVIAFELSTNSSNGLIFWHGQTPNEAGDGQDYISLGIVNGYLEFSFDLGSGPVVIRNSHQRVDDGQRYNVILKRKGQYGSIDLGNTFFASEYAPGSSTSLDCHGNIFLGGTPNIELMTAKRFSRGFDGCIHGFELQNSNRFDLGVKAISGLNVKPCSSFNDIFDFDDNELVN